MNNFTKELKLDKADLAILRLLQENATMPARLMAEKLSMSPSSLWRRINELEKLDVIMSRVALLNPEKVNLPVCVFVSVNLVSHEADIRLSFEGFVAKTPEIVASFSVTGAHDYTMIIRAADVAAFEKILMGSILAHKSVASATSQIALRQQKYTTALPL
jgi:Lrp/AsnC family transcriptional regulator